MRIAFEIDAVGSPRAIAATDAAIAELVGRQEDSDAARPAVAADGAGGGDPDLLACALLQRESLRLTAGIGIDRDATARAIALLGPEPRRTPDGDELPESLRAHALVAEGMIDLDDLAGGRRLQERELERNVAHGLDRALPIVTSELALTALWMGTWDDADRYANDALTFAAQAGATAQGRGAAMAVRAAVDAYRGDLDAAASVARDGVDLAASSGDWVRDRHETVLGFVALTRGDPATANDVLGRLYDRLHAIGDREMVVHRFVGDLIDAAAACGDLSRVRMVVLGLGASVRTVPRPWVMTMEARGRAVLAAAEGDLNAAMEAIDTALGHATTLPMPFEVARTELTAGLIARRRKERRRATEALGRARVTFERLGAARWVEIVDAELARTGRRTGATDELTETEDRVARLAASGLTNREVGEAAFLTPKSVEGVLARVYGKLGYRLACRARCVARGAGRKGRGVGLTG